MLVAEEEKTTIEYLRLDASDVGDRVRVGVIATNSSSADKCTQLPLAIRVPIEKAQWYL